MIVCVFCFQQRIARSAPAFFFALMKIRNLLWLLALTMVPTLARSQTVPMVLPMVGSAAGEDSIRYVGGPAMARSGEDMGAQINAAYASLPPQGGTVVVITSLNGACYDFVTPIVAATPGKYLLLESGALPSQISRPASPACLNYLQTTASSAMTLDYVIPGEVSSVMVHGVRNLTLMNNQCQSVGGCGSAATGIMLGGANGGAQGATFDGLRLLGFGNGVSVVASRSRGGSLTFRNCRISYNTQGFADAHDEGEHVSIENCYFEGNATGISSSGSIRLSSSTMESNTVVSVSCISPAACDLNGDHFENSKADSTHFLSGDGVFSVSGGDMRDMRKSGNTDWWMNFAGAGFLVLGTSIATAGRIPTHVILNERTGLAVIQNNSPAILSSIYSNPDKVASLSNNAASSPTTRESTSSSSQNSAAVVQNASSTFMIEDVHEAKVSKVNQTRDPHPGIIYIDGGRYAETPEGINAAIQSLPGNGVGGTIYLPCERDVDVQNTSIVIDRPLTLMGCNARSGPHGTRIVAKGTAIPLVMVTNQAFGVRLVGFGICAGPGAHSPVGIDIDNNAADITLDHIYLGVCGGSFGIANVRAGARKIGSPVMDLNFVNTASVGAPIGFLILRVNNVNFYKTKSYDNSVVQEQLGDQAHRAVSIQHFGCDLEPNTQVRAVDVRILNAENVTYDGCYFENNEAAAFEIPATAVLANSVNIHSSRFTGNGVASGAFHINLSTATFSVTDSYVSDYLKGPNNPIIRNESSGRIYISNLTQDSSEYRLAGGNLGNHNLTYIDISAGGALPGSHFSQPVAFQGGISINSRAKVTGIQGTGSKFLTAGEVSGVGRMLCTDANAAATTSGCEARLTQVTTLSPSCMTGNNSYDTCSNALNWPIPFSDGNYAVTCSGIGPSNPRANITVAMRSANSVTVNVVTYGSVGVSFSEIDCTGVASPLSASTASVTPSAAAPLSARPTASEAAVHPRVHP